MHPILLKTLVSEKITHDKSLHVACSCDDHPQYGAMCGSESAFDRGHASWLTITSAVNHVSRGANRRHKFLNRDVLSTQKIEVVLTESTSDQ
jgi:hypothetical protein